MSNNIVNDVGMRKRRAALLSVGSNTLLIIVKIADTHTLMEQIEKKLQEVFPETRVPVRPEPCVHFSERCTSHCHWEEGEKVS